MMLSLIDSEPSLQAHLTDVSSAFAGHHGVAIRPVIRARSGTSICARFPVAFRPIGVRFFCHPVPAQGLRAAYAAHYHTSGQMCGPIRGFRVPQKQDAVEEDFVFTPAPGCRLGRPIQTPVPMWGSYRRVSHFRRLRPNEAYTTFAYAHPLNLSLALVPLRD